MATTGTLTPPSATTSAAISALTTHAWFSADRALRHGSSVFVKAGGATVNVTRTSDDRDARGPFPVDENYLGQVVRAEAGGCVESNRRVDGISSEGLRATAAASRRLSDRTACDGGTVKSAGQADGAAAAISARS
jgi:hypothetical protein